MKMNWIVIVILAAMAVSLSSADEPKKKRGPMTQQERVALHERIAKRRTGGIIRKHDSAKGAFVILNAQSRVPAEEIEPLLGKIDRTLAVKVSISKAEGLSAGNIAAKIGEAKATVGVGVVDDPSLPSLLVAPETGWALVNVAKLDDRCPDAKALASRVRKEIMRSLAFTTGCAYMTTADPLMRDVVKPGDIDGLPSEEFGFEIISHFLSSAPLYGLKPWYSATYRKACEEGWAPAPTNEYQKAIWEKVHEMPTEPIKIKPETKKVKE